MHDPHRAPGTSHRSGQSGRRKPLTVSLMAMMIAVGGWLALGGSGNLFNLGALAMTPATDSLSAAFSICGDSSRMNCVVDGDTLWFRGEKIRIADIDTPELSPPRCQAERMRGEAAKARLLTLLNAGKFSLVAGRRDEDRFGRKLRVITRAGRSLGDTLIDEGLARRWDGARHGWCG